MTKHIDVYHAAVQMLKFPVYSKVNNPFEILISNMPIDDERCIGMKFKDIGNAYLEIIRVSHRRNKKRSFIFNIHEFPQYNMQTVVLPIFKTRGNMIRFTERRVVDLINIRLLKVIYEQE